MRRAALDRGRSPYAFTVLVLKRSILTEKVARRGFHISREYAIDPLEILFVRDVITLDAEPSPLPPHTKPVPIELRAHLDDTLKVATLRMAVANVTILPIIDSNNNFLGEIALGDVLKARLRHLEEETRRERIIPIGRYIPIPDRLAKDRAAVHPRSALAGATARRSAPSRSTR